MWGSTTEGFPLGKLSPKVTDEGRFCTQPFLCRKIGLSPQRLSSPAPLGESIAPSSAPVCALGHLPPGEGFGGGCVLSDYNTHPSQPAQLGAGRYGRWVVGRRPGKKRRGPPAGPPQLERWVQGGRTSSSLVFFPPAFFQRKPGPRGRAGNGLAPQGGFERPTRRVRRPAPRPLTGAGREPPK